MTRVLPPQPDLDHLKNEAKSLHKTHSQREAKVCHLLRRLHRFVDATDEEIFLADVSLTDVQFALAMDYGFDSWKSLRQAVLGAKTVRAHIPRALTDDIRINLLPWREELQEKRKKGISEKVSKTVLGLDISSTSVKLLELSKSGSTFRVESCDVESLPGQAVVEKEISDIEVVGETIARLIQRSNTQVTDVAVAVAGSGLITKTIEMPAVMGGDERYSQIVKEADRYIPLPLDQVVLDFEVQRTSPGNKEQVEVLLAACRREYVEMRQEAVKLGGLTAKVVDIEGHCIRRAYQLIAEQLGDEPKEVVAIVDGGATMTTLTILTDASTPFIREKLFGGRQLTDEIQRRYPRSFQEAELAKKQGGLPDDYEEEVLKPFKQALVQQVMRTLQFFYSVSRYSTVDQIVLTGGSSSIDGIADLMTSESGIPTMCANPVMGMASSSAVNATVLAEAAPALMMACGLAMRSFD